MQVNRHDREIQLTLEATVALANGLVDDDVDVRRLLAEHGFSRAAEASAAAVARLTSRMRALLPLIESLPEGDAAAVTSEVNDQLAVLPIVPTVSDHDASGLHMHWTPATATFDDQVLADVLMAIALETCERGTRRFGRCSASDCAHLFYDATRNGRRRFCADPRCASRTHTAQHRARRRAG